MLIPIIPYSNRLHAYCRSFGWSFLAFRLWIGIWVGLILLILVATDASAYVSFITRFTEENFATLIGIIFVIKAIENVLSIGDKYPLNPRKCICEPAANGTEQFLCFQENDNGTIEQTLLEEPCVDANNVLMTSIMIFAATYLLSTMLKKFKTASYFPTSVRGLISDFSVIIALVLMTGIDYFLGKRSANSSFHHHQ